MSFNITIGIITYKRPKMLETALQSIKRLALPLDAVVDGVVVDNDSGETVKEVVANQIPSFPMALSYHV